LLEHHYVADMRRGRGGGLTVVEPDPASLASAVALYLKFHKVDNRDLFETRQSLELSCAQLAAERATESEIAHLRELAGADEEATDVELARGAAAFHSAVAAMSGNPAMHLFVQVLTMLTETTVDHGPATRLVSAVHNAHSGIAEAIASGDAALARHRMLRHFQAMAAVDPIAASSVDRRSPERVG
jgi:DNA-binding FadR family transcriptional regulator